MLIYSIKLKEILFPSDFLTTHINGKVFFISQLTVEPFSLPFFILFAVVEVLMKFPIIFTSSSLSDFYFILLLRNFPQVISNCNTIVNPSFFEEERSIESDYKSGVDWAAGVENYFPCSIERRKVEGWWRAILIFIVVKLAHKRKLKRKLKKICDEGTKEKYFSRFNRGD